MFGWRTLGPGLSTAQTYRALAILREHHLPCRMSSDDMFFVNPFRLPHPDRRWDILVRRGDRPRALALLEREGVQGE